MTIRRVKIAAIFGVSQFAIAYFVALFIRDFKITPVIFNICGALGGISLIFFVFFPLMSTSLIKSWGGEMTKDALKHPLARVFFIKEWLDNG